jgi:hypothetical protein
LLFRGADGCAFATVEPKSGKNVPALLWLISSANEAALDRYEGLPRNYHAYRVKDVFAVDYTDGTRVGARLR